MIREYERSRCAFPFYPILTFPFFMAHLTCSAVFNAHAHTSVHHPSACTSYASLETMPAPLYSQHHCTLDEPEEP